MTQYNQNTCHIPLIVDYYHIIKCKPMHYAYCNKHICKISIILKFVCPSDHTDLKSTESPQ